MDPISFTGAIISSLTGVATTLRRFNEVSEYSRLRREGQAGKYLIFAPAYIGAQTEAIAKVLKSGSDDVLMKFRDSYVFDCNMTAVAAAIIAQVAITGLSLPSLSQTHWLARALFIISLISGALSVYFSVMLQKVVGTLYTPQGIRAWLSGPLPPATLHALGMFDRELRLMQDPSYHSSNSNDDAFTVTGESIQKIRDELTTLEPSASAASLLYTPSLLLGVSLGSFILALGIYLGFVWTRNLDPQAGTEGSRAVFIFYIIGILFFLSLYYAPATFKAREVDRYKIVEAFLHRLEQFRSQDGAQNSGTG